MGILRFAAIVLASMLLACTGGGDPTVDDSCVAPHAADAPPVLPFAVWSPTPGTTWQWQLQGTLVTSYDVAMYDVDLFDTSASTISALQTSGRTVICYFSAGSFEDWRPDVAAFPDAVKGLPLDGWAGERWLDVRAVAVRAAMAARLDLAASNGCDGVEPDNVDGYANETGFPIGCEDQLLYNRWLAEEAHARGLSVGLKNDLGQIPALVAWFDWALNEQCFQYDECDLLAPFVNDDKAVFGVEYVEEGGSTAICSAANAAGFSWLIMNYDLDATVRTSCLAN
jgi:hypothetical protein